MNIFYLLLILFLLVLPPTALSAETLKDVRVGRFCVPAANGDLYVNQGDFQIIRYSAEGKQLIVFGREGEGPGDFRKISSLAVHPQDHSVYVTDLNSNRWISHFSAEGAWLGEFVPDVDRKKVSGFSEIHIDHEGCIYVQTEGMTPRETKLFTILAKSCSIIKFSPQGKKLAEIYHYQSDFSAEAANKGNVTIPFENYLNWLLDERQIYVRENAHAYISVFDLKGKFLRRIELPFKRHKITEKDINDWYEYMKALPWVKQGMAEGWYDLKFWRKNLVFPEWKPPTGGLMALDGAGFIYCMSFNGDNKSFYEYAKADILSGKIAAVLKGYHFYTIKNSWKGYFLAATWLGEDDFAIARITPEEYFRPPAK